MVQYAGTIFLQWGLPQNVSGGEKAVLSVANAGLGYMSLVGSFIVLPLLDTERIVFLATRSNSFVASSSLLYWVGSEQCVQQRGSVGKQIRLRIP